MTMGRDGNRAKWEGAKLEEGEMAKGRNGNVIWAKWERAKWERAKWEDTVFLVGKSSILKFQMAIFQADCI
jgi:hypothetical protein